MSKALFVFYYYGEGFAAGIQNKRLTDSLFAKNIDCKVICRFTKIKESSNVQKIDFPEWKKLNTLQYKLFPGLNGIITLDELFWTLKVLFILKIKAKDYKYVHIASSPFFIQFIGYFFKKRSKCKWIVQLLDPISDNNYINQSKYGTYLLRKIEKIIINSADLILINNERLLYRFKDRYLNYQNKFKFLLQITDENIITSNLRHEKITLYHTGSLSALRNIDFLVRSLVKLRNISNQINKLEVHFVGNCSKKDKEMVTQNNLDNVICFSEYVSFVELKCLLSQADALIIIDALGSEGIFAASKLCEYFSYQKLIFAITPKVGVTADIFLETGHMCFDEGDEEKFALALNNLIIDRNFYNNKFDVSIYKKYLPNKVADNYVNLLSEMEN